MPFVKTITLPSTAVGEYHVITGWRWNLISSEVSVELSLYVDATAFGVAPEAPLMRGFAMYRAYAAKFGSAFTTSVLATSAGTDGDSIIDVVETEITAACVDWNSTGDTDLESHLICDAGKDFYWDATVV